MKEELKIELKNLIWCVMDIANLIIKILMNFYFWFLFITGIIGIQSQGIIFPEISKIELFFLFIFIISSAYSVYKS